MLCGLLDRKKLLFGAISSEFPCERHMRKRGVFGEVQRRVHRRLTRRREPTDWMDEHEGVVGRVLSRLPPQTAVIYQYHLPEIDHNLPIRRFLFQDITVRDAAESGGYGHKNMSKAEVEQKCEEQRRGIEQADGVLCFSTHAADSICRDYGYLRERVTPLGSGPIRTIGIRPLMTADRYAAARILFVGRKWEAKGGPLLLEAFREVRKALPQATLTIVGPSVAPCDDDGIRFVGLASDRHLLRLFSECSVFCMPSICETWGIVYSEAAHAGMPIAGFKAWAMPDVVEQGRTGRLASERTPDALADVMIEMLKDPERLCTMGVAARQRVDEVLDWPHVLDRLLSAVLPEALNGTKPVALQRTDQTGPT